MAEEPIAAQIGLEILESGGNAIDAAIATAFALAVSYPEAGNIGGGGFALVYNNRRIRAYDFREVAPLKSHAQLYLDTDSILIRESNHEGLRSVGVPGTVAGLGRLFEQHASMKWSELLYPAIALARDGFKISHAQSDHFASYSKKLLSDSAASHVFFPEGKIPVAGWWLQQPKLAQTLERISSGGWKEFYNGETARELVSFCDKGGGWIDSTDLANYKCIERKPTKLRIHETDVFGMPEPSSGGLSVSLILARLYELSLSQDIASGVESLHLSAEVMRSAFEQRAFCLGDPDLKPRAFDVETYLKGQEYQTLLESINRKRARKSILPEQVLSGDEGQHTTHISICDKDGRAVSLTYTLERNYGSGIMVPQLGFLLNNEMGDFNPWPGQTDSTGLIGTEANLVRAGARMLSSMSPTIVLRDGDLHAILGTRGGRTIINSVALVLDKFLREAMSPWESITAPRIHHQWFPDRVYYEKGRFTTATLDSLEAMGHTIHPYEKLGSVMAIMRNKDGRLMGIADPRSSQGTSLKQK